MVKRNSKVAFQNDDSGEPEFVRLTALANDIPDPEEALNIADVAIVVIAAVGTVLGSIMGGFIYTLLFRLQGQPTLNWKVGLLVTVALGGACGAGTVLTVLGAKKMIRWENRPRP